jgi:hypothetical protein
MSNQPLRTNGHTQQCLCYDCTLILARRGDAVNHPKHYTHGAIETIDVIEDWNLGYHLGQVIKYISRCDHKGKRLEDLKKAQWYLEREIAREAKDDPLQSLP